MRVQAPSVIITSTIPFHFDTNRRSAPLSGGVVALMFTPIDFQSNRGFFLLSVNPNGVSMLKIQLTRSITVK